MAGFELVMVMLFGIASFFVVGFTLALMTGTTDETDWIGFILFCAGMLYLKLFQVVMMIIRQPH